MKMRELELRFSALFLAIAATVILTGCAAKYVTPAAGVNLAAINDYSIEERFKTKPASPFPARIAVVRVQESGYYSHGNTSYGQGRFSIVTTRDIEKDEHFDKLSSLPDVAGLATLNRLLVPSQLNSVRDLRTGAASLHADMLLLYTLDTSFRLKGKSLGPLTAITLGFLPNKKAFVTTTASAVLYDVRTGHVYGMAEASHESSHIANTWSKSQAIDNARLETEKEAFAKMVDQFVETWDGILSEYKTASGSQQ